MDPALERSTVRYAVVGAGFAGAAHVEALRRVPGVEVTWLVAGSDRHAADAAARLAVPSSSGDYRAVVEDAGVDVVDNCTPNHLHAEVTEAALAAGKHVLSEKPLAMDSEQTARLVDAAERAQLATGVCFNYRHFPMVVQARTMLADGRPHLIRGGYLQDWLLYDTDWNWRLLTELSGASRAVADIGSHWIDLVQHVTGRRMVRVFARLGRLHQTRRRPAGSVSTFQHGEGGGEPLEVDTEDFATVMFDLDGGCPGVFTVSQVSPGMRNRLTLEIDTADACLAWNQERPNRLWIGHRDRPDESLPRDPALLSPEAAALTHYPAGHQEGWPDALANLVSEFTQDVLAHREGRRRQSRVASFAEADRVTRTVEAIVESGRSGAWVTIADSRRVSA
jgi:predicted dehydrogenase